MNKYFKKFKKILELLKDYKEGLNEKKITKKILAGIFIPLTISTLNTNANAVTLSQYGNNYKYNNIKSNQITQDLYLLEILKNTAKEISNIKLNKSALEKIERVDYQLGPKIRKTIEGYIELNKLLLEALSKFILEHGYTINQKETKKLENIKTYYYDLIKQHIKNIENFQNDLENAGKYLMFIKSFEELIKLEHDFINTLKQYDNKIFSQFFNQKLKKIFNKYEILSKFSFNELFYYYYVSTKRFEREIKEIIDIKNNFLRSFKSNSYKLKKILEEVSNNNINGIYNELVRTIDKEIKMNDNEKLGNNEKIKILEGIEKKPVNYKDGRYYHYYSPKKHETCREISSGIEVCGPSY